METTNNDEGDKEAAEEEGSSEIAFDAMSYLVALEEMQATLAKVSALAGALMARLKKQQWEFDTKDVELLESVESRNEVKGRRVVLWIGTGKRAGRCGISYMSMEQLAREGAGRWGDDTCRMVVLPGSRDEQQERLREVLEHAGEEVRRAAATAASEDAAVESLKAIHGVGKN